MEAIFLEICLKEQLGYASLSGYVPQYLLNTPYFNTSLSIIRRLNEGLKLGIDTGKIEQENLEQQKIIGAIMERNPGLHEMIAQMEREYDHPGTEGPAPTPTENSPLTDQDASSMAEEVERFLRGNGPDGKE